MNLESLVSDFHRAYNVTIGDKSKPNKIHPNQDLIAFRMRLIVEEYEEVLKARLEGKEAELLKELMDLVYVVVGTAVAFGWDFEEAFKRVHNSNMSKLGLDGKPVMRADGKVLKGPNYAKPDLKDLV